jgi:hypothetical protein
MPRSSSGHDLVVASKIVRGGNALPPPSENNQPPPFEPLDLGPIREGKAHSDGYAQALMPENLSVLMPQAPDARRYDDRVFESKFGLDNCIPSNLVT